MKFPDWMTVAKFDDHTNHYLSHSMRTTGFIFGIADEYIVLIELKNPDHSNAR